jgi:hypothetical protein
VATIPAGVENGQQIKNHSGMGGEGSGGGPKAICTLRSRIEKSHEI